MNSKEILGPEGPLAGRLEGFVPREGQQQLAARIEAALADDGVFIAESGTGTGKTFAYLVPALLSGKKVLISTGTKNLQDQLFHRDLPLVRDALKIPVSRALLKGRSNYLCRYRFEGTELEGRFASKAQSAEWVRLKAWAGGTRSGDIAELNDVPEDSTLWPRVTSTADNCVGSQCEHYHECFVNRARREALAADVLVVNHHLFFADLALREEGFGQLLPGVDAVIFDEAHQLPDIASRFLGQTLSSRQLNGLCQDTLAEELKEHSAVRGMQDAVKSLQKAVADFRLAFGVEPRRDAWGEPAVNTEVRSALATLGETLSGLMTLLEIAAGKSQGFASCYRRAVELLERLTLFSEQPPPEFVAWFETTGRGFVLYLTPLEVATAFQQHLRAEPKAWVFTSATLAIDRRFEHFQVQMGLEEAETGQWDSPFDFAGQTLLYLPQGLPVPAHHEYTSRVVQACLPVLEASQGRAFLLFTSYRALRIAAELLEGRLDYPLLVQGSAPRAELLARFRDAGNAILLGTSSFWEGVDVRGEALSCVIIDKLPFAAPDDPVLRARGQALEQAGRNAFMGYQLPNAVIALKQGAGRLIRDEQDSGVLVLCDPRLLSKGYGRVFLHSLPPMPVTREVEDVRGFFAREATAPGEMRPRKTLRS